MLVRNIYSDFCYNKALGRRNVQLGTGQKFMTPTLRRFCTMTAMRAQRVRRIAPARTQHVCSFAQDDIVGRRVGPLPNRVIPSGTKWSRGIPFAEGCLYVEDLLEAAKMPCSTSSERPAL